MLTKGAHIDYDEHDERILRRLGGALIVQWDQVPQKLRDLIIQQAADMVDRMPLGSQGDFQIEEFIKAHKGGD